MKDSLTTPNNLLRGLHITCTFQIHDLVKPKEIINGFENRYWSLNTVCVCKSYQNHRSFHTMSLWAT